MVTMLKDLHQQMDLQVKSPLSTLIMAQSSRFFTHRLDFLYFAATGCDQTQESIQVDKLLRDQRDGFLVAVSSLNLM